MPEPLLLPIQAAAFPGHAAVWNGRVGGLPAIVQAWASCDRQQGRGRGRLEVTLLLNRSCGAAELFGGFDGEGGYLKGCRLFHVLPNVSRASYSVHLAITSPYFAMVTDGKEPDLLGFVEPILDTVATAMRKSYRKARPVSGTTQRDAAFEVMAEAYDRASAGNTLPANAGRSCMPPGRSSSRPAGWSGWTTPTSPRSCCPTIWRSTLRRRQTGTSSMTRVAIWWSRTPASACRSAPCRCATTCGRARHSLAAACSVGMDLLWQARITDRYRTVLFIEKEGFEPLLRKARIAERFDCGIMSTKGMSVTAARALVEQLSRDGVRILVAHDLDRSGFSIFGTLAGDTRRWQYQRPPEVVDLGLRLGECRGMGLQDEEAPPLPARTDRSRVAATLSEHGATMDEIELLLGQGRRIELNAMTSDQLLSWLEAKLRRFGAGKVVPPADVLKLAYGQAVARRLATARLEAIEAEVTAMAAGIVPPADLAAAIEREIAGTDQPWDEALVMLVSRQASNGSAG